MPDCTKAPISFPALKRKKVEARFDGGSISSDGGSQLLRQIDHRLGLLSAVDEVIPDPRNPDYITHSQLSLLRQRVYGLALGYEDLNDHDQLRQDIALQASVEREELLGSSSTLCRLENRIHRQAIVSMHEIMVSQFIASFSHPPEELILDFDATDDRVHGNQIGKAYHGYYGHHCFLPLYVFCGDQLLVSYLRPSNQDQAKHSWAILSLLVKRLRQAWPHVSIIFRADGGFCRHRMLDWCDKHGVGYIVGLTRNAVLMRKAQHTLEQAQTRFNETGHKQRWFTRFVYRAGTWSRSRKVVAKVEMLYKGKNLRYIVTNLKGKPRYLYDHIYCARGEMENRIKEQQLDLFADRTSAHEWWANQFRLMLSSLAYILVERLRAIALQGTKLAQALISTIRQKLLKIGAVIVHNTRRITLHLASYYPYKALFAQVAKRLSIE